MNRREFITFLGGAAAAWPLAARAQQRKSPRIGFLSPSVQTYQGAFGDGLRALGYTEGQNIAIEYRFAQGNDARLPELAKELVALNVDVIVATNASATNAAMNATRTIPIVMVTSGDPLLFVQSLSRPGGNVTGTAWLVPEMSIKQLELLREFNPQIALVAVLWSSANPTHTGFFKQLPHASQILGVELKPFDVRTPEDFGGAFDAIVGARADALLVLSDQLTIRNRPQIINFANERKLPSMYALREFAISGGLMSYGVGFASLYFRAATFVDKLLKGASPADLPVELPTKYELVINLKTAKSIGFAFPTSFLLRADEVIE
jgi:putative ABC transport system substrate-binding protein